MKSLIRGRREVFGRHESVFQTGRRHFAGPRCGGGRVRAVRGLVRHRSSYVRLDDEMPLRPVLFEHLGGVRSVATVTRSATAPNRLIPSSAGADEFLRLGSRVVSRSPRSAVGVRALQPDLFFASSRRRAWQRDKLVHAEAPGSTSTGTLAMAAAPCCSTPLRTPNFSPRCSWWRGFWCAAAA